MKLKMKAALTMAGRFLPTPADRSLVSDTWHWRSVGEMSDIRARSSGASKVLGGVKTFASKEYNMQII